MTQEPGLPNDVQDLALCVDSSPDFWPDATVARDIQVVETPPAFRRRLLFTYAEPLMNARFPNDRKVRMPFWQ